MPKLGESVTEGTIGKWLKQPGEKVNKYELLVEVQTDKVNTEIPSPVAGTLKEVKVEEGQTVPIGTLLAVFDTADGEVTAQPSAPAAPQRASQQPQPQAAAPQAPKPSQPGGAQAPQGPGAPAGRGPSAPEGAAPLPTRAAPPPPQSPSPASQSSAAATATAERPDLSDVRATPAVRKLASEQGVDISQIEGTGLGGRVSRKDVEDFIAQRQSSRRSARCRPSTRAGPIRDSSATASSIWATRSPSGRTASSCRSSKTPTARASRV